MLNVDTFQLHLDTVTEKASLVCPICKCKDWTAANEPVKVQTGYMVADPMIARFVLLSCDRCYYTMMFSYQDQWGEEAGLAAALSPVGEDVDPDMLLPDEAAEDMEFSGWGDELPEAAATLPDVELPPVEEEPGPEPESEPEPEPEDDQVSVLGAAKKEDDWIYEDRGDSVIRHKKQKNGTVHRRKKVKSPDPTLGGAVDEHAEAQKKEAMLKKLFEISDEEK